ncbi:MAG TPA: ABC transporter permease subunit [Solirubrobacteraceae bacterium]|nr:ABC transporter permease subunit [Solirubrobacteraceae bacterium]
MVVVVVLVVVAAAAPLIVSAFSVGGPNVRHPGAVSALGVASGPSSAHPFGVDELGRDVLARVVYGARTALFDGVLGALLAGFAGGLLGLAAARAGAWGRNVTAVVADAFTAFPVVLVGLAVGASCDAGGCAAGAISPGVATVVFAVALCGLGPVARAAAGGGSWRPPAAATLRFVPAAILLDAALGFLGAGVRGSTADWGQMLAGAEHALVNGDSAWWLLVFPGVALVVTVGAWRLLGGAFGAPPAPGGERGVVGVSAGERGVVRAVAQLPVIGLIAFMLFWVLPERAGASMFDHSTMSAIWSHLSGTVSVLAGVVVVWLALGPLLGVAAVRRRGRPLRAAAYVLSCAPVFWLGLIAVWLFASDVGKLGVLPGVGRYVGLTDDPGKWVGSLALPWIVLGLWWAAWGVLAARADAGRIVDSDFVRLARAKGLPARRVFWRHVVRAAASVCVRRLACDLGVLLGGVLLIEVVFGIGGAGLLAYQSARLGAVEVAQWTAVLAALLVVIVRALPGIRR